MGGAKAFAQLPGITHALWFADGQSEAPACRQLRMRSCCAALGGRKGSSRRRGRRGCGCVVRVGVTDIMPGIVELPTLEELKVEEVRLVWRTGKRDVGLKVSRAWPSPASTQQAVGSRLPHAPPTHMQVNPRCPFFSSRNRPTLARSGSRTLSPPP